MTARLTGPISAGIHEFPQTATPVDLDAAGYVEEEFAFTGEATSYRYAAPPGADGEWPVEPDRTAPYTSRMLVRRPHDVEAFNGTVVVEWLNVTAGVDVDVDFGFFAEEVLRAGHADRGHRAGGRRHQHRRRPVRRRRARPEGLGPSALRRPRPPG